jgi:hypothetical protein
VVFFLGGVMASSPPSETASNATWIADYATHGKQVGHVISGVCLVLAGMSLMIFLTQLWTRVAAAQRSPINPLPVVAAGVTTTCMCIGGLLMVSVSGLSMSGAPLPPPYWMRFGNDVGFVFVGGPAMVAAAIGLACLAGQAFAAGVFGSRLRWFTYLVAALLLASFLFIPIAGLMVWVLVTLYIQVRQPTPLVAARPVPGVEV